MKTNNRFASILLCIFIVCLYSCQQTTIDLENVGDCCPMNREVSRVSDAFLPIISLQQTPCYGQCPAYTINIYADKTAVLEGIAYLPFIGAYKTIVSDAFIQNIQCRAFYVGYFSMADTYPQVLIPIADAPSVITRISSCNRAKTITETGYAPEALHTFEQWLIKELMRLPWTNGVHKRPPQSVINAINPLICEVK